MASVSRAYLCCVAEPLDAELQPAAPLGRREEDRAQSMRRAVFQTAGKHARDPGVSLFVCGELLHAPSTHDQAFDLSNIANTSNCKRTRRGEAPAAWKRGTTLERDQRLRRRATRPSSPAAAVVGAGITVKEAVK